MWSCDIRPCLRSNFVFFCMEGWVGVESDGRSVREGGREGGREVKIFLWESATANGDLFSWYEPLFQKGCRDPSAEERADESTAFNDAFTPGNNRNLNGLDCMSPEPASEPLSLPSDIV